MCNYERKWVSLGFTEERFQLPLHMCYIFRDDEERVKTLAKFIRDGIDSGDKVYYFVDTMSKEDMKKSLIALGVGEADFENHNITLTDARETYLPDGTFKPDDMLNTVKKVYVEAMDTGSALRNTGEMSWVVDGAPGTEHLMEYEAKINILMEEIPINGICQYDARLFDGETILDVLSVHPYSIVAGQVVKNPFYIPPEKFLERFA